MYKTSDMPNRARLSERMEKKESEAHEKGKIHIT